MADLHKVSARIFHIQSILLFLALMLLKQANVNHVHLWGGWEEIQDILQQIIFLDSLPLGECENPVTDENGHLLL